MPETTTALIQYKSRDGQDCLERVSISLARVLVDADLATPATEQAREVLA